MIRFTILVLSCLLLNIAANAQLFEFSTKDAVKISGRKLIVVMQEEDPAVLKMIRKNKDRTARYSAIIAYSNAILRKTVPQFWKASEVEYKTVKECQALSDSSQAYYTLDFASLRNENLQLYLLKPDTHSVYGTRAELTRRREFGYFELKLIEKFKNPAFYTFYTPASIPNEYDFITAIQFISSLVSGKLNDPKFSSRNYELKIQSSNVRLKSRTLLVDSALATRQQKNFAYIRQEYDSLSLYELSTPQTIVDKVYKNDTVYAYLNVVPYIDPISRGQSFEGTSGGNMSEYEKNMFFMQLIIDVKTGDLLYYDKADDTTLIPRDWRRFQRFANETGILDSFKNKQDTNQTR